MWPNRKIVGEFFMGNVRHGHRSPAPPRQWPLVLGGTAFTVTELFTRARWDAPLTWTGQVPVRCRRALAEAGTPAPTSAPSSRSRPGRSAPASSSVAGRA